MREILVPLAGRPYKAVIGAGVLGGLGACVRELGAEKTALITHAELPRRFPEVRSSLEEACVEVVEAGLPVGEAAKNWDSAGELLERLAAAEMHRGDVVVALGGGVVTDVAGFVAATLLRGVRWIACPTTILGAVDAAVGGKTGVNLRAGKNLAGAFWQPSAVFIDTRTFASLPVRDIAGGLAEAVKCGFIRDPVILDIVGAWGGTPDLAALAADPDALEDVIARAVAVKAAVVAVDERESGPRAHLNYGHTLGHALETASSYRLSHGEAISVGMVFAAELALELGMLDPDDVERHRVVLGRLGLPTTLTRQDAAAAVPLMRRDKKYAGGRRYVLLNAVGQADVVGDVPDGVVEAALARVAR